MVSRTIKYLVAGSLVLAAAPALAQSNSANEGAAATPPDGTYATPMTPPPATDQDQAQRQANSDPYNMPQNRDAYSAHRSDPDVIQNEEANGNGQAPSDADSATPSERPAPPPSR